MSLGFQLVILKVCVVFSCTIIIFFIVVLYVCDGCHSKYRIQRLQANLIIHLSSFL